MYFIKYNNNNNNNNIHNIIKKSKIHKIKFTMCNLFPTNLIQSIIGFVHRTHNYNYNINKHIIKLKNGGQISVSFISKNKLYNGPIIIICPGLGNNSLYNIGVINSLINNLYNNNLKIAFINYQGMDTPLTSPNIFCGAYIGTNDLTDAFKYIRKLNPKNKFIVIAISFGSAMFTNWACRNIKLCKEINISCGIMLAHGYSLKSTLENISNKYFGIISKFLLNNIKKIIINKKNIDYLNSLEQSNKYPNFKVNNLINSSNLKEWEIACLPLYKYKSIEHMYSLCDSYNKLCNIPIYMCYINSLNDPICLSSLLLNSKLLNNNKTIFICTSKGGHLGWIDYLRKYNGICWLTKIIYKLIICFIKYN